MRGHREPALLRISSMVRERGEPGRHALLEVEADEMAVQRADLLAHDHVDAEVGLPPRVFARGERAPDLVVIGDGEHVDAPGRRRHHRLRSLRAVAPGGVDVQIGPPLSLRMAWSSSRPWFHAGCERRTGPPVKFP